jgi:hypothetical protein
MRSASGTLLWSALDVEGAEGARSGDPLGLRVLIRHLGGRISPALTRSSSRVWGFGLLALGVRLAGPRGEAERRFLRWQRLLVLAAAFEARQLDGEVDAGWRVGGIARATRMVEQSTTVRLDRPLLAHERSSGLWGGFARACRMYGIVTHGRLGNGVTCTASGNRLADAARSGLRSHQQEQRLRGIVTGRDDLAVDLEELNLSLANPGDLPRRLSQVLTDADRKLAGGRFADLWPQLRGLPMAHPREVDLESLANADLRQLLAHQRDVADLVEEVEGAFREGAADRLSTDLATHPAFSHARSYGYTVEYDPVAEALALGGSDALAALQRLHEERHPRAGRWRPGEKVDLWDDVVPDFGLDAIHRLAEEGVEVGR